MIDQFVAYIDEDIEHVKHFALGETPDKALRNFIKNRLDAWCEELSMDLSGRSDSFKKSEESGAFILSIDAAVYHEESNGKCEVKKVVQTTLVEIEIKDLRTLH